MRESLIRQKFSSENKKLGNKYEIIPIETKLEDGFPDLVIVERSTGKVCLVEIKYVRSQDTKIKFRTNQPLFLRKWVSICSPNTRAWVFCKIERAPYEGYYLIKPRQDVNWITEIKKPFSDLDPELLTHPLGDKVQWTTLFKTLFE